MLICDKCGTEIPDGSKFCPQCADPITELDVVNIQETTTLSTDTTSNIRIICPKCESQFNINAPNGQSGIEHTCPKCSTVSQSLIVQIRSKNSRGSKKEGKREFTVRVYLPEGGETLIEFVNANYDDIELRSKDFVLFTYLNGQLKIILNYTINQYTKISRPNCYIATFVFGPHSEELRILRDFRDFVLLKFVLTSYFVKFYYFVSPHLISSFGSSKLFKFVSRLLLRGLMLLIGSKHNR